MAKVRRPIRIVSVTVLTIFTIFLLVCITAGVIRWKRHSARWTQHMGWSPPSPFFVVCYESCDFVQDLYAATRYYCWPAPPTGSIVKCRKIKYAQRYLQNEKVKRIAFGMVDDEENVNSLRIWGNEITEPEKIERVLQLISTAQKDINAANIWMGKMLIITDKHQFIIPVEGDEKAIYGWDWTSKELKKQLWKWGYDRRVYEYDLPSKEQAVAIILYSLRKTPYSYYVRKSPPLAFFGDKKLAEKLIFEQDINDPNGVKGPAGLYQAVRLSEFGVKARKEAGEYIYDKELKPEHIFEGREWLEKIINAYKVALKEAEKIEKYFPMELDNSFGEIVFMTLDKNYWKEIGIDENAVFDDYIKSEQLKAYFDELGLTKELLEGEP